MIVTTTETVPDHEITEVLGVVRGNTVRSRNIGRDITQLLRSIVGGELKAFTTLLTASREESLERMKANAEKLDADAVVNVRFVTAQVMSGSAEMLAYGTAVTLD